MRKVYSSTVRIGIIWFVLLFSIAGCDFFTDPSENSANLIGFYPNYGNKISVYDSYSFQFKNNIDLNVPDSLDINGLCLSTTKQYFVISAYTKETPRRHYVLSYNISKDAIEHVFSTGLGSTGSPRMIAAYYPGKPGLIYFYGHHAGMFSIDFMTNEIKKYDYPLLLGLEFYLSKENESLIVTFQGYHNEGGWFSQVDFYSTTRGLDQLRYKFNENNEENILYFDNVVFTENNTKIFISFRTERNSPCSFGEFNLNSKTIIRSHNDLPWNINPYFITYSSKREEIYFVSGSDTLYVADGESVNLTDKIFLKNKIGVAPIYLREDEKILFINSSFNNEVIVFDLEINQVIRRLDVLSPYLIFDLNK